MVVSFTKLAVKRSRNVLHKADEVVIRIVTRERRTPARESRVSRFDSELAPMQLTGERSQSAEIQFGRLK